MRINIQQKMFASYLFVVVVCVVLLVAFSLYSVIVNFQHYSQAEPLTKSEKLFWALINEGKIPEFRYIPPSLEEKFFNSMKQSLIYTGIGTVLLAAILSFIFSRAIVTPTRKMIGVTKEIAGGDYSKRLDVRRKDEIGDLALSLNQMAAGLEKIETMRRELVSNVSHELATPLTNISGYLEALHDKVIQGSEPTEKTLQLLREEADRLTSMVEDMRKLASIESSKQRFSIQPLNLGNIVEGVILNFKPKLNTKSIEISNDVPADLPDVLADEKGLNQILFNLLDNAINFTSEGGKVIITAGLKNEMIQVKVTDTGIGIPDADLPHIFERFYRSDKSRSRETGGTGIGLAIVKELVSLHGGAIEVESKVDTGSTFTFSLPLAR